MDATDASGTPLSEAVVTDPAQRSGAGKSKEEEASQPRGIGRRGVNDQARKGRGGDHATSYSRNFRSVQLPPSRH